MVTTRFAVVKSFEVVGETFGVVSIRLMVVAGFVVFGSFVVNTLVVALGVVSARVVVLLEVVGDSVVFGCVVGLGVGVVGTLFVFFGVVS